MPEPTEKVRLHDIEGVARLSGTDENGNAWIEFELDPFAADCDCDGEECEFDTCPRLGTDCDICGDRIDSGWTRLDGGEDVCSVHIEFADEAESES